MELRHIAIENIHDTKLNMRHDRRPPDVSDILPTVKAKGILQPLLVRPYANGGDEAVDESAVFGDAEEDDAVEASQAAEGVVQGEGGRDELAAAAAQANEGVGTP